MSERDRVTTTVMLVDANDDFVEHRVLLFYDNPRR
jgi:hypothetical protein